MVSCSFRVRADTNHAACGFRHRPQTHSRHVLQSTRQFSSSPQQPRESPPAHEAEEANPTLGRLSQPEARPPPCGQQAARVRQRVLIGQSCWCSSWSSVRDRESSTECELEWCGVLAACKRHLSYVVVLAVRTTRRKKCLVKVAPM